MISFTLILNVFKNINLFVIVAVSINLIYFTLCIYHKITTVRDVYS